MKIKKIVTVSGVVIVTVLAVALLSYIYSMFKYPEKFYKSIDDGVPKHFLVSPTQFITLTIPSDYTLNSTDGVSMWNYSGPNGEDSFTISRAMKMQEEGGKLYNDLMITKSSITKTVGDYIVTVTSNKRLLANAVLELNNVNDIMVPKLYRDLEMESLPMTQDETAKLSAIGVYVPPYYKEGIILALTCDTAIVDDKFYTAYRVYNDIDEVQSTLTTWLRYTDPNFDAKKMKWYKNRETFYAKSNGYCVGARAMATNSWALIYCTEDTESCLLMNLTARHPEGK